MARDNIRQRRNRKQGTRILQKIILIVCEGECTEPEYFNLLKTHLKLSNVRVEVKNSKQTAGTSPKNLLKYAKALKAEAAKKGMPYDLIYCVFDKDKHTTFEETVAAIKKLGLPYNAITSCPCFEYWLLLHYSYTTASYNSFKELERSLKKHVPTYNKSDKNVLNEFVSLHKTAVQNAQKAEKQLKKDNQAPFTNVHHLILELVNSNKK